MAPSIILEILRPDLPKLVVVVSLWHWRCGCGARDVLCVLHFHLAIRHVGGLFAFGKLPISSRVFRSAAIAANSDILVALDLVNRLRSLFALVSVLQRGGADVPRELEQNQKVMFDTEMICYGSGGCVGRHRLKSRRKGSHYNSLRARDMSHKEVHIRKRSVRGSQTEV
jgi:hypothetical protein